MAWSLFTLNASEAMACIQPRSSLCLECKKDPAQELWPAGFRGDALGNRWVELDSIMCRSWAEAHTVVYFWFHIILYSVSHLLEFLFFQFKVFLCCTTGKNNVAQNKKIQDNLLILVTVFVTQGQMDKNGLKKKKAAFLKKLRVCWTSLIACII